jgi:hypothetical protein
MGTDDELLNAYDEQLRGRPPATAEGVSYSYDGPVLRIVGQFRGFVTTRRDIEVTGAELDRLIARQRDFFSARGEAVEWKTRGYEQPAELPDRLLAAGFVPEDQETVLIGRATTGPGLRAT